MTQNMEPELNYIQIYGGFRVPKNDTHISAWQVDTQQLAHAPWLSQLVIDYLAPAEGKCILDLGAYDGDHSIEYSRAIGPRGSLVAVEAGSLAFSCLVHNVSLFQNPKNTYALHACVSENCGDSVSHISDPNLGASTCKTHSQDDLKEGEVYLRTVNIDFLRHQLDRKIDFIKMDIEGYELRALIGGSKTLKNDRPGLLIEVNPGALMLQGGDTPEDIYQILNLHNYSWSICQPECTAASEQYDILCLPNPTKI